MNDSTRLAPSGGGTWQSLGTLTFCAAEYALLFDRKGCDGPCLKLFRAGGSGSGAAVYDTVRGACTCTSVTFFVGDPAVCTGAVACGGLCANVAEITVSLVSCLYAGAGWYCVRACGTDDEPVAVELTDADAADPDIEIVSGPYDSAEHTPCTPAIADPACLGLTFTMASTATMDAQSGGAVGCVPLTLTCTSAGPNTLQFDLGAPLVGCVDGEEFGENLFIRMVCVDGVYNWVNESSLTDDVAVISFTASPFTMVLRFHLSAGTLTYFYVTVHGVT